MKLINFSDFVVEQELTNADEETTTMALIRRLAGEICPRVLLEDFPTSEFQAKFFVKNCVAPSHIFHLSCGKDECQERMINLGQGEDGYLASSILSKRIREFNENQKRLLPYLDSTTNLCRVNTEQPFDTTFSQLCAFVEPKILLIRQGGGDGAEAARDEIVAKLTGEQGFTELSVNYLLKEESARCTDIGREFVELNNAGKYFSSDMYVTMLRKNIYSGV